MRVYVLVVLGAYLLGSIPFAFLITRAISGRDVRNEGKGNPGSRNAAVLGGRWAGILTAIADIGKGVIVYYVARRYASTGWPLWFAGATVVIGHCYPVFLRFRGGKGMATVTGFLLPMYPLSFIASLAFFYLVYRLSKSYDLMFFAGSVFIILATYVEGRDWGLTGLAATLFGLMLGKYLLDAKRTARIKAASGWQEDGFQLVPPKRDADKDPDR